MEYLVGVVLALAISSGASAIGMDRERSFYPTVLAVVATYYALFAIMAGSSLALLSEAVPMLLFTAAAALGFRRNAWIIVASLALHGVFDFIHRAVITNPGVPPWWPGFCLAYDVTAAVYLAVLLLVRKSAQASGPRSPSQAGSAG